MGTVPQVVGQLAWSGGVNGPLQPIRVIDSHTEGEPTRVIVDGGPDLGSGPLSERLDRFADEFDAWRRAVIHEPRGFDHVVGGLLCEPQDSSCAAGVIFFNNTGYLNMCGHGTIGLAVTLAHLGRIGIGRHRIETPVGVVVVDLRTPNEVSFDNVLSYVGAKDVAVEVEGLGRVVGDVAWGGNWFYLIQTPPPVSLCLENVRALSDACAAVRRALERDGITGSDGGVIDHIEFFAASADSSTHSRNFVYCPGGAYDRSPCGTGTSAKLAVLAASGKLQPGESWVQESVIASQFAGVFRPGTDPGTIIPTITGRAWVCGEATLLMDASDPYRFGISGSSR